MARKINKSKPIAYWDSNLFIKWFTPTEERWEEVDFALNKAKNGELLIVTSALTLAEVVKINGSLRLPPSEREKLRTLFDEPYIEKIAITPVTGELARELVWDHNIDPKDALHVAAAIERRVPVFHCYDGSLRRKGESRVVKMLDFEMRFKEPLESFPDSECQQTKLEFDEKLLETTKKAQDTSTMAPQSIVQKPRRRKVHNT